MSKPSTARNADALRITNQYHEREKAGTVYELRCGESKLALLVSQSGGPGAPEWRFEARTAQAPQLVVIGDWGTTKLGALEAVGRLWVSKVDSLGLPTFDWVAVATALATVRAV